MAWCFLQDDLSKSSVDDNDEVVSMSQPPEKLSLWHDGALKFKSHKARFKNEVTCQQDTTSSTVLLL